MSLAELIEASSVVPMDDVRPTTNRVLLLGNDDRVLLAVARGLGRNGISVDVAWCDPKSPALKSRYVKRFHLITPYEAESTVWLESLHALTRQHDYDLVIPCNDFAVVPLQMERDRLDSATNWYLVNQKAFEVAFDKSKTSRVAAELGINLPREYTLTAGQLLKAWSHKGFAGSDRHPLRFPVYVKPRSSITRSDVMNKRSAQRVETPLEFAQILREDLPAEGLLVQESFSGVGIGVEVLACDGEVLMQIQHRRLRETIDGGSTYRETIPEIPELTDATRGFVERLDFTGVGMFEYRYNLETKEWVFLEINARFWGSLPLAVAAGANFPHCLYEMLVTGRRSFGSAHLVGVRGRNLVKDLRAYRQQPGAGLALANLLLGKDHLDFFASDDWRPQVATLAQWGSSIVRKICRR